jgi:hypothetical protein
VADGEPNQFILTLNKAYFLATDDPKKKTAFMYALVRVRPFLFCLSCDVKLAKRYTKKGPKLINTSLDVLQGSPLFDAVVDAVEEMQTYQNRESLADESADDGDGTLFHIHC